MRSIRLLLVAAALQPAPASAQSETAVSEARKDANGFLIHEVRSAYQAGVTRIRVLLRDKIAPEKKLPIVFVLPVEAGTESRDGDGLTEVKKHGLHNAHKAVVVAPTFSHLPWYADHPDKSELRQEAYFLRVVVPFVDKAYPVREEAAGRHLLGFSKSGWGAFILLLRNPGSFGRAAAWDAPQMMAKPDRYGMGETSARRKTSNITASVRCCRNRQRNWEMGRG